jgi:hypothetical protein
LYCFTKPITFSETDFVLSERACYPVPEAKFYSVNVFLFFLSYREQYIISNLLYFSCFMETDQRRERGQAPSSREYPTPLLSACPFGAAVAGTVDNSGFRQRSLS